MSQKLEKILNKHETCRSCKSDMVCGEATYQGTKKLQWQNADGKAHYKKDGDKFTCNIPAPKGEQNTKDSQTRIDETDPVVMWTKDTYETEIKIKTTLRKLMGGEPDVAHVGLYLKLRKEA